MDRKNCSVCNQSFNSDRELQEHQKSAHSTDSEKQPTSDRNYGDQNRDRERIA